MTSALGKIWLLLIKGGRGVSKFLTFADQGERGGFANPLFWLTSYVNSPVSENKSHKMSVHDLFLCDGGDRSSESEGSSWSSGDLDSLSDTTKSDTSSENSETS